jgi:hypothetical protein
MDAIRSADPALAELGSTYLRARVERCAAITKRAKARGELSRTADHRLVFELLMGPFLARALISDDIKSLDSRKIVRAVLNGVTSRRATV